MKTLSAELPNDQQVELDDPFLTNPAFDDLADPIHGTCGLPPDQALIAKEPYNPIDFTLDNHGIFGVERRRYYELNEMLARTAIPTEEQRKRERKQHAAARKTQKAMKRIHKERRESIRREARRQERLSRHPLPPPLDDVPVQTSADPHIAYISWRQGWERQTDEEIKARLEELKAKPAAG